MDPNASKDRKIQLFNYVNVEEPRNKKDVPLKKAKYFSKARL